MKNVTIYTTPTCGFCHQAKQFFQEKNVPYEEKDVAADQQAREEMVSKTNQMGVPVIEVDDEIVIGFDQSRLAQMLDV